MKENSCRDRQRTKTRLERSPRAKGQNRRRERTTGESRREKVRNRAGLEVLTRQTVQGFVKTTVRTVAFF
jgi:hypothetical protein